MVKHTPVKSSNVKPYTRVNKLPIISRTIFNPQQKEVNIKEFQKYTQEDVGCYIDGTLGLTHGMEKLAELVKPFDKELAKTLKDKADDYLNEEVEDYINDATEILQNHTTEGLFWEWDTGDLILTDSGYRQIHHQVAGRGTTE